MALLIKNGRVIDPSAGIDQVTDVLIDGETIREMAPGLQAGPDAEVLDAAGKIVAPGLIDMHVHLREPGYEAKETIATGTRAAVRGGFTAVACMPNTRPVADNQAVISLICERARLEGVARVYPIGCITREAKGAELAEMADLAAAGAVAFSDDGRPVVDAGVMRRALEYASMLDRPIIAHCEEPALAGDGVMHEGYYSTVLGLKGIPAAAEEVMVARDLLLAEMTGCPLHIAHVSTAGSVRLIREAKQRGVRVTAEATPHHFTLTDAAVEGYDTNTKVNPPLRSQADVEAVIQGLADGSIDAIATDHAPHAFEEKDVEYDYAPFGMVGLETAVPLIAARLVVPGHLTWPQALAKVTCNPARILHVQGGVLAPGGAADLTIIDPELERVVDCGEFASRGKNSPFGGWRLRGWPVLTVVGGRVAMREGRLT